MEDHIYTEQQIFNYAGFWRRFVACFIDSVLLGVCSFIIGFIFGFIYVSITRTAAGAGIFGNILGILISWIYHAVLESSPKQATLGKMAIGIIVTDLEGERLSFARATGRHFAKILSAIILLVGYIMAGFTARKQALHDIIAGCLVIQKP